MKGCGAPCAPSSLIHLLPELGAEGLTRGGCHPAAHGGTRWPKCHRSTGTVQVYSRHLLVNLKKTRQRERSVKHLYTQDLLE